MLDTRITAAVASLRFTSLNATVAETYPRRSEPNLDKSGWTFNILTLKFMTFEVSSIKSAMTFPL
jgi:hypothetical protein